MCAPGGDRKGGVPDGEGAAADRLYDGEVFRCELWLPSASCQRRAICYNSDKVRTMPADRGDSCSPFRAPAASRGRLAGFWRMRFAQASPLAVLEHTCDVLEDTAARFPIQICIAPQA